MARRRLRFRFGVTRRVVINGGRIAVIRRNDGVTVVLESGSYRVEGDVSPEDARWLAERLMEVSRG